MSKDWRSWFEPKILDRGYNYFLKENVMDLKKTAGGYQAFVMGTRMYTVRIALNKDEVISSSCNCPYAMEGNRCKHQAAALFKYEAFLQNQDEEYYRNQKLCPAGSYRLAYRPHGLHREAADDTSLHRHQPHGAQCELLCRATECVAQISFSYYQARYGAQCHLVHRPLYHPHPERLSGR